MIVLNAVGCFLVWLMFVGQTSAFLQVKFIELHHTKSVLYHVQNYPKLAEKAPSLFEAASKVAQQGLAVIKANPTIGASIYLGGILVTGYHLTNDANKQLMEAQFHFDELDMIIEAEILPALEFFDTANKMKIFCNVQSESIDEAINYLRGERKKIEEKMIELTTGQTKSKMLKYLSGGVGVSWIFGTAATCLSTGPACPLVAGSSMVISSGIGYYLFGESQSTYRQSIEVLALAREKALRAEEKLRQAKVLRVLMMIQSGVWSLLIMNLRIP